jgi:hypothetical protein
MKLRGRELYIIAGVIAVVVVVAWYFFFMSKVRDDIKAADASYAAAQTELSSAQQYITRLEQDKKAAPASQSDLVRLNKLLPAETEIPSAIIEIQQAAKASGLNWDGIRIQPTTALSPFSIQPIDLSFIGKYFDIEDFLYRLENFVEYRHETFLVSGRMFAVTNMTIGFGTEPGQDLDLDITIVGYLWTPQGSAASAKSSEIGGN